APFLNVQKTFDRSRSSLGLHGDDVCSHQFRPRSSSNDASFLKDKRRQIMTTLTPCPQDKLLEDYYNPTHGLAEENNNDQAPNASFQEDEFINPFCTRVQEIGESSSRNIDNTDVHSFQPQSHDYQLAPEHRGNPCCLSTDYCG
ncbi:hypothetical protein Tco_1186646, partial [Tanacetum coccineum]